MYPAYYSAFIDEETKELVDYAEINYRVLKDVDENGNVVYGLVNNGDLLKTVRLARTSTNTHITTENGQSIEINISYRSLDNQYLRATKLDLILRKRMYETKN